MGQRCAIRFFFEGLLLESHDDFQFLECFRPEAKDGEPQDASKNEITERHEHEASARYAVGTAGFHEARSKHKNFVPSAICRCKILPSLDIKTEILVDGERRTA
jgi:hypothetical protein